MEQYFAIGPLSASFLLGFATILLFYWYYTRNHGYWKKRGVPYATPYPVFGSSLQNFLMCPHHIELERYNKYGAVYGHFEGNSPLLSIADPILLRNVLVKDFHAFTGRRDFPANDEIAEKMLSVVQGEDWKRIRTIITPTFTTGKLKRMLSILKESVKTLINNFQTYAEKGEPVDAKRIYGAFTMDSIACSAFSTKIDSHNNPNNKFVTVVRSIFTRKLPWRFIIFIFFPTITKLLRIKVFFPEVVNFFSDFTRQLVEERKKSGQVRNDFLQLMLDSAKEMQKEGKLKMAENEGEDIAENYGKIDCDQVIKNVYTKKSLSFTELVAQCVIFFIAGYDTTASTLAFATYLLALHPDVQRKVRHEVDEVLEANNGEMTYDAIQSMKYLDNVIAETLRMYPVGVRLERKADEDYKLGDTGITISKGMNITIPVYALHMDPKYYPEPEKFDPDRFKPEERAKREQYVYIPFGAGPRNCIAMRFALLEVKMCLAEVIRHFIIKRCPETKVPLEFYKGQPLLQPKSVFVELELRNSSEQAL